MDAIPELAQAWRRSHSAVVLTGAGASTDSGLPDFRSKDGLWSGIDPMKLASLTALRNNPVEFYRFYRQRLAKLAGARPNPVHIHLARIQQAGLISALITQNIDGLHQAAGSTEVIEMHGSLRESVCMDCRERFSSALINVDVRSPLDLPRCPKCGGVLKPGVILFEEPLPAEALDRAVRAAEEADLFVVIGSSLEVGPVNQLPAVAATSGADLAMINLEPTHLDAMARWCIRRRGAGTLDLCRSLMGL